MPGRVVEIRPDSDTQRIPNREHHRGPYILYSQDRQSVHGSGDPETTLLFKNFFVPGEQIF